MTQKKNSSNFSVARLPVLKDNKMKDRDIIKRGRARGENSTIGGCGMYSLTIHLKRKSCLLLLLIFRKN